MPKSHNVMDFLKPYQQSAIFLSFCALFCLLSLVLLNQDLNPASWDSNLTEGGKVISIQSQVRRKNGNSLLWNSLTDNNHLFNKDSILVGPGSHATFELKNGEKIELGEDSFFVVDPSSKVDQQLKRGALILTENGERTLLKSNPDGILESKKLLAQLETPENNAQIILAQNKELADVEFDWSISDDQEEMQDAELEVSTNKSFAGKLILPNDDKYLLPEGTYYWRVKDEIDVLSEVRIFNVMRLAPLALLSPANSENIVRVDFELPISFNWKPLVKNKIKGRKDKLLIAEDKEFKKPVYESTLSPSTGFTNVKLLKGGTYYWKLTSSTLDDKIAESEIRHFTLSQTDSLSIKLQEPKENVVLRKRGSLLFQWELIGVDAEAQLEIKDFSSKKLIYTQSTKGSSFTWKDPIVGSHLWRVSANNALRQVAASDWRVLTILDGTPLKTISPAPFASQLFWKDPSPIIFSWEPSPTASGYLIDFSDTSNFGKILFSQSASSSEISSENMKIPLGKLFWRIRAVDSEQQTINMSESVQLTYDHPPPLVPPVGFNPPEGTTWDVVKEGKDLVIEWERVPDAKMYEVTVSGNNISTFNTRVEKPELTLKRYKSGKYSISVAAVDVIGRPGQILGPVHINVHYSPLRAPAAEEPEIK